MAPLLKDNVNEGTAVLLGEALQGVRPDFPADDFVDAVRPAFGPLELKDRINLLADEIANRLPVDFGDAADILVAVAAGPIDPWAAWPLCSVIERHGVDHPEVSLAAMPHLTKRWSCEFAIRPFLEHHLDLTRPHLRRWAQDSDEAVRRLASEGTRPRLPWGPKVAVLDEDPGIGLELLELLRHDPSETVRRSVANHLNDVSRAAPDLVVTTLDRWTNEAEPVDEAMVRHALRTLIKQGDPAAMGLLGFATDPLVEVLGFGCDPSAIELGDSIELTATLASIADEPQKLVVDFVIHHVNAGGDTSPKVFKWTTISTEPGGLSNLAKKRLIKNVSTRRYHPGSHRVDLQVAGRTLATTEFTLSID